jgi:membrane carboxypeptidase/penicillin-binding protein
MIRNFNIELEDNLYQQLKELCKGEESTMREYILQTLKERLNQNDLNKLSKDKTSLESYLNKGQRGSRNYGVKGQGW